MTKHLSYDLKTDGVTKTLLNHFIECPLKADYFLQGWESKKLPMHIHWGSIFHDVKEIVYTNKVLRRKKVTDIYISKVIKRIAKNYRKGTWTADEEQEFEIMLGQISAIVKPYFDMWKVHDRKLDYLPFEEAFLTKVHGGTVGKVPMRGRWDGLFIRKGDDKVWVQETKTKAQISPNLSAVIPRDLQVNMYQLAAELLTGKEVAGVLYDVVRRPGLRRHKGSKNKPQETLPDFINRIRVDIEKRPQHYFQRIEVVLDKKEYNAWKKKEFPKLIRRFSLWLKNGRGGSKVGMPCINRYGGLCQYFPICSYQQTEGFKIREHVFPELEDD